VNPVRYAIAAILVVLLGALAGQHWVLLSTRATLEQERTAREVEHTALERAAREALERHQADLLRWREDFREIEDGARTDIAALAASRNAALAAGDAKLAAAQRMLDGTRRAAAGRDRVAASAPVAGGCPRTEPPTDLHPVLLGWLAQDAGAADEIAGFADESASARAACQRAYEVTN
jgi:hypothetical protein